MLLLHGTRLVHGSWMNMDGDLTRSRGAAIRSHQLEPREIAPFRSLGINPKRELKGNPSTTGDAVLEACLGKCTTRRLWSECPTSCVNPEPPWSNGKGLPRGQGLFGSSQWDSCARRIVDKEPASRDCLQTATRAIVP